MNIKTLNGIIAYPITPFLAESDQIDLTTLNLIIDNLIDTGIGAIAALGSAGEGAYLDEKEWQQVAEHTVTYVADRVPVIIGISELTTGKVVQRAQFAQTIGADVLMISPLSYYPLTEREIYQHYETVSNAVDLPIMLYNNPATSGIDMSPEFMLSMISGIKNVQSIKESTGDIQRMHQIYTLSGGEVPFYNGCNYIALEALNAGATGWCTVAPCLIGKQPKQLFDAVQQGEALKARDIFYRQREFLKFIVDKGLAASVKSGLAMQGVNAGSARKPLLELDEASHQKLSELIQKTLA